MNTTKLIRSSIATLALCALSSLALAIPTISLQPAIASGPVGGSIFVDLVWDGDGANYIGDFDIDISYDDSIVSYEGAMIDPVFGVDSWGCFIICEDGSVPGVVDLHEVSIDPVADLMANQDGLGNAFVLATMEFKGLTDGFTDLLLSGTFGNEDGLGFAHNLANGKICVGDVDCTQEVPEPATIPLLALGLIALALGRKKYDAS